MSLFSLCVCTARGSSPQEAENFRAHRDRGPPGVTHMSRWWEGKKRSPKWLSALFLVLWVLKWQMLLHRVHLRWRATWRVWPESWRLTYQTTKTKSCAYCVLCKPIDLVPLDNCMIPPLPHVIVNDFCLLDSSARLLPEKLTVYTTLVGLLNARNYNFGGEFVEAMIRQLKETLKNNLYDEAVHLVCWFWIKRVY